MKQKTFHTQGNFSVSETTVKIGEMTFPLRQVAYMNVTQQPTSLAWIVFMASCLAAVGFALSGYNNGQFYTTNNALLGIFVSTIIAAVSLYFIFKPKYYFSIKSSNGSGYTAWSREYSDLASMRNGVERALVGIYVPQNDLTT